MDEVRKIVVKGTNVKRILIEHGWDTIEIVGHVYLEDGRELSTFPNIISRNTVDYYLAGIENWTIILCG